MKGSDPEVRVLVAPEPRASSDEERRHIRRTKVAVPLRAVPDDPRLPEEVQATINVSRRGLYFITWKESYYVGMRLRVEFPYWPSNQQIPRPSLGRVVRVDILPDGSSGVAVHMES